MNRLQVLTENSADSSKLNAEWKKQDFCATLWTQMATEQDVQHHNYYRRNDNQNNNKKSNPPPKRNQIPPVRMDTLKCLQTVKAGESQDMIEPHYTVGGEGRCHHP